MDSSATDGLDTPRTFSAKIVAHGGVLVEVDAGRVGGGTDVEQHHRSLVGDHLDGERGAINALESPEIEDRRRDAGTGVTRCDHRVGRSLAHEAHATLMLASRLRRTAAAGCSSMATDSEA